MSKESEVRRDASPRLWDAQPALWDVARQAVDRKAIPRGFPQPEGIMTTILSKNVQTAVNLGTPRLKIGLWGPPQALTLSLGKTDVWDRRLAWESPLTLDEIRRGAFDPVNEPPAGDAVRLRGDPGYLLPGGGRAERYSSWDAYPFPCPKPVGQAIVRCGDMAGADTPSAEIRYDGSPAQVRLTRGAAALDVSYLSMMDSALVGIRLQGRELEREVSVRLYRHRDTVGVFGSVEEPGIEGYDYARDAAWNGPMAPPESGADGRFLWIRQRFPAEKTFPDGFEYVLMARVPDQVTVRTLASATGLGTSVAVPDEVRKQPFGRLVPLCERENAAPGAAVEAVFSGRGSIEETVWLTVVTSAEADDPAGEARRRLLEAECRGFAGQMEANRDWYRRFYERREDGRLFGEDSEWARKRIADTATSWRVADNWLSNPDPTRFEADEEYAYLEADRHPWHALPCLNEVYFTADAVRNRCDRLSTYYAGLVRHWFDAARQNAREVFGLPGMFIAHGYLPPIRADRYAHTISTWEFCMEIPAQTLKPVWDAWDYGADADLLEQVLYPALRELAIFYSSFVTRESDGKYHAVPTVSAEHWGWTYRFARNRDSSSALSMIAWTLRSAVQAAETLGRDEDQRAEWRRVAQQLAPYPVWPTAQGPIFGDVAGVDPTAQGYNFFPGVMPTVLADQITLDSGPDEIDTMLRTASSTGGWKNQDVYHLLGAFPDRIKGVPAAEFNPAKPDVLLDTPEACLNAFEREPERLLNSRGGSIHLFPCVPPDYTVAFRRFQARGGFLVSAEMRHGTVTHVCIEARRNVPCVFANPWPGETVEVRTGEGVAVQVSTEGARLTFAAQAGEAYQLSRLTME